MAWQDVVLFVGGFILAGGIVPAVRSAEKPPVATTLTLVIVVGIFIFVFVSLGLWLTALSAAVQWALWAVVLAQTVRRDRRRS